MANKLKRDREPQQTMGKQKRNKYQKHINLVNQLDRQPEEVDPSSVFKSVPEGVREELLATDCDDSESEFEGFSDDEGPGQHDLLSATNEAGPVSDHDEASTRGLASFQPLAPQKLSKSNVHHKTAMNDASNLYWGGDIGTKLDPRLLPTSDYMSIKFPRKLAEALTRLIPYGSAQEINRRLAAEMQKAQKPCIGFRMVYKVRADLVAEGRVIEQVAEQGQLKLAVRTR